MKSLQRFRLGFPHEAYLRLSRNVSKSQRNQLVEKLLVDLHLEACGLR